MVLSESQVRRTSFGGGSEPTRSSLLHLAHRVWRSGGGVVMGQQTIVLRAADVVTAHTMAVVADYRQCEQCGSRFEPRREHARFCSADCRDAWNREHSTDPAGGASALLWSIAAMNGT